jgi:ABC-type sugar transport system ATPase subunit
MPDYILEARGITKTFPGVKALDGVDLRVRRGETHAVVGENGAGKSTLMMVLTGVYRPDAGQILMDGTPVSFHSHEAAVRQGVSIVYQELSLVPSLSIAENIFTNRQPVGPLGFVRRGELLDMHAFFTYTIMLEALAILGHLSAASRATGPRISEPFISPSGVIITAALSSN